MAIMFKSEDEYRAGLRRLDTLLKFPDGTPEKDEADFLLLKVEAWENPYEPDLPDPIAMIKYAMEQRGWTSANLAPLMKRGRVSEIFQKKRPLSLRMIRWFHSNLGISLETLVQDYKLAG
jgi:HTH-type transcriptional regulator / antitoxin HigA